MDKLEQELKELIVDTLKLEDTSPDEIDSDAPLFVEGLGLDSIDALELAMAIKNRYGVQTTADDERNREIFSSVRSLSRHVAESRKTQGGCA